MWRYVFDSIGDGVLLTDENEIIVYINQAAADILGCKRQEAYGRLFSDVCSIQNLDTGKICENPISKAMRENNMTGLEKNSGIINKKNGCCYISATCSPIRTEDSRVRGCSIIIRDITKMREQEKQRDKERRSLKAAFMVSRVGMCILNAVGGIMDLNEVALNLMGREREQVMGVQFGDGFCCCNSFEAGCGKGVRCQYCMMRIGIENAMKSDEYRGQFILYMKQGDPNGALPLKELWLKVFISQIWRSEQKEIIISISDISATKRRELELDEARRAAEDASKAKGQFLANMSHEIRTPINGMTGMIDLTLRSELSPKQRENLESAKQCSIDLLALVNDILDYSKLEIGRMQIETIRCDMKEIIDRVSGVHGKTARSRNIEFTSTVAPDVPQYFRSDPTRLRQILHNLLSNALKFTEKGSVSLDVYCKKIYDVDFLCFTVKDTGIGMKKEDMDKLFRPFSQVDGSITRRFGGTGLGLMIVKELVSRMGGKIDVESTLGKGSTFTFTIPCIEESGADQEKSRQTVFVKPQGKSDFPRETDCSDIADLLDFCENRLKY
jgi:PAS domain S-box-containing protein